MKTFRIFHFLLLSLFLFSCEKENDYGDVLLTFKHNGKTLSSSTFYMKKGTLTNPNIALADYDKSLPGDASCQASFENLEPGNYFFYGKAYDASVEVSGEVSVTVKSRYRQNWYEVDINGNN